MANAYIMPLFTGNPFDRSLSELADLLIALSEQKDVRNVTAKLIEYRTALQNIEKFEQNEQPVELPPMTPLFSKISKKRKPQTNNSETKMDKISFSTYMNRNKLTETLNKPKHPISIKEVRFKQTANRDLQTESEAIIDLNNGNQADAIPSEHAKEEEIEVVRYKCKPNNLQFLGRRPTPLQIPMIEANASRNSKSTSDLGVAKNSENIASIENIPILQSNTGRTNPAQSNIRISMNVQLENELKRHRLFKVPLVSGDIQPRSATRRELASPLKREGAGFTAVVKSMKRQSQDELDELYLRMNSTARKLCK
jgi:hypothetical protein